MTKGIPHPFEIFYDPEEESYFMFCPEGCVLVGGKAATNDEIENGNLRLDFGEAAPDKVYLHVSKKEAEEGEEEPSDEWEFSVDGSATKAGASYNVLVARFGQSENDGNSYDVVCSAISLGGSGKEYVCGPDSNVVLTPAASGADAGKTCIDVYYV